MAMQTWNYRSGSGSRLNNPLNSPSVRECDGALTVDYNRSKNTVVIENPPSQMHKLEIVSLFHSLIGEVQSFRDVMDGVNSRLELTFFDHDAATKALCMNGYTVSGVPLSTTAHANDAHLIHWIGMAAAHRCNRRVTTFMTHFGGNRSSKVDDRRNLYVLGLPFALTKSEFAALFAQYGTVSHCVILATVDNSSRRRGFIVMSTHEEAKIAMSVMTRTQIKGHTIDVSWAVVQRSQGFLDGGDRSMVLDARTRIPTSSRLPERSISCEDLSQSRGELDSTLLMTCSVPTTCLLVSNLPTLLFSQAQDLHPLVFPFGQIDRLEIVHVSPLGCLSVIVEYSSTASAQDAKESLNGQLYGNFRIEARYVSLSSHVLHHSGRNMAPRLRAMERRMTDPLPHSSDYVLHRPCSDDRPVMIPLTPQGVISANYFDPVSPSGVHRDVRIDRESNHSTSSEDSSRVQGIHHLKHANPTLSYRWDIPCS